MEDLARDIYSYFKNSSKRLNEFDEFNELGIYIYSDFFNSSVMNKYLTSQKRIRFDVSCTY